MMQRCPGQDQRYWTPDDIFDVNCPYCDASIEFWKDEPFRVCRSCMKEVRNPRMDLGCAKWCKFSDQCLGRSADAQLAAAPVIEKLKARVEELTEHDPKQHAYAVEVLRIANLLTTSEGGDPCRVKTAALLVGVLDDSQSPRQKAKELLAETVLDVPEIDAICELLASVLAGKPLPGIDAAVVHDARLLAGEGWAGPHVGSALLTEGARMIHAVLVKKRQNDDGADPALTSDA